MIEKRRREKAEAAYKRMCKEELSCLESGKVGRKRRGRKKNKEIMFPYPKRGQHRMVDGMTVRAMWVGDSDDECRKKIRRGEHVRLWH
jgi:hypothetical protein